jgi:protein N-terminal amidase
VYGVLGRGVKQLLVVDTDDGPFAKLVSRPGRATAGSCEDEVMEEDDLVSSEDSRSVPPTPGADGPEEKPAESAPLEMQASVSAMDTSEDCPTTPRNVREETPKAAPQEPASESPKWSPKGLPEGSPRADSPILSSGRPQLSISTDLASGSPTRVPQILGGVTSAGTLTPPPTGEFPEAFYQEAVRQDQLQSAMPNLYTPEEPQWPPRDVPEVHPSSPRELPEAQPVPPTRELEMVDSPAKEASQDVISPPKENQIPLAPLIIPLPEEVPLPAESSSERASVSGEEADQATAIPPGSALGEEFPLIFVDSNESRRDSRTSEASISIGMEGGKDVVVV